MTLTRNVRASELDTMSLFQDLKLKRRKIDSRCSSDGDGDPDGESTGSTSTSSCTDIDIPSISPPHHPPIILTTSIPMQIHADIMHSPTITITKDNSDESALQDEGQMECIQQHSTVMESELHITTTNDSSNEQLESKNDVFDGGGNDQVQDSQIALQKRQSVVVANTNSNNNNNNNNNNNSNSNNNNNNNSNNNNNNGVIISRNNSDTLSDTNSSNSNSNSSSEINNSRQSTSPEHSNSLSQVSNVTSSPQRFWISSPPTCTNTTAAALNTCRRINGVRPELIGGMNYCESIKPSLPTTTLQKSSLSNNIRSTPAVIMGEAGGVRTMIWSAPSGQQLAHQTVLTSTNANWNSTSESELLGNSGQEKSTSMITMPSFATLPSAIQQRIHSPLNGQIPLNMERLWAGDFSQLPSSQQLQALNLSSASTTSLINAWSPQQSLLQTKMNGFSQFNNHNNNNNNTNTNNNNKQHQLMSSSHNTQQVCAEEEQPMICMICEDKATGLHYGIITCEGCKGFFKRTVQNRRVYTCVADGGCEITKAQRNRCQYCRFKKCLEQGMVLQAVREDRMPGGRNSGAVYNLYKIKYNKKQTNKKAIRNGQIKIGKHLQQQQQQQQQTQLLHLNKNSVKMESENPMQLINGTILKTALTNPSEVVHLRQRLDNAIVSSSIRDRSIETTLSIIQFLIDCDEFQDIATLRNLDDFLDNRVELSEKLMHIGDSIVYKLVQWTKRLPFYMELPVEVHTKLLTHRWHELLVLTTSAYQAIYGNYSPLSSPQHSPLQNTLLDTEEEFDIHVSRSLLALQSCLTSLMGRSITLEQLRQDVGLMVEKITHIIVMFRQLKLRIEEYVCLKVIIMLNPAKVECNELEGIQERYINCLKIYTENTFPQQPSRFNELMRRIPEVRSAAALLLESKMFYVPFLLNSTITR